MLGLYHNGSDDSSICQGASLVKMLDRVLPLQWAEVRSLGWEDPLEEGFYSTPVFLPGESPWIEEPGGLQSTGSQRVGHD